MTTPHPRDMGHTVYSWQSNCWGVGWGRAGARSIQSNIVLPLDPPHPISCQVLLFHLQIILQYALFSHSYTSALLQPCPESLRQSSPKYGTFTQALPRAIFFFFNLNRNRPNFVKQISMVILKCSKESEIV